MLIANNDEMSLSLSFKEVCDIKPSQTPFTLSPQHNSIAMTATDASSLALTIPQDSSLSESLEMVIMHHLHRVDGIEMKSFSENELNVWQCHISQLTLHSLMLINSLSISAIASGISSCPSESDVESNFLDELILNAKMYDSTRSREASVSCQSGAASIHLGRLTTRKALKLTDDEILKLYHVAQNEAAAEADWRDVQWQGVGTYRHDSGFASCGDASSLPRTSLKYGRKSGSSFFRTVTRAFSCTPNSFSKSCRWPW